MGCLSHRSKDVEVRAEQKWDYINLKDFRTRGCGAPFAYAYLWFSLLLSITVYAVDSFTAVNLLAFNRWSSEIKPAISIDISKYIFSVCIIASFVNLGYEGVRAARVMKRDNIAECYLDNLAVRWESIRPGRGQGYRRFLVFAELTKSKKGTEYIALFTYFSFQSWLRVLLCAGPRQVVNAFTLRSVYQANLQTTGADPGRSLMAFFGKLAFLARSDYRQAAILSGMLFTLVIWVFSMLFLITAVLFYVFFLWHWIPRADGGLTGYCERKVNKALLKIVTTTVNKALAKEQISRRKAEARAARKNGEKMGPLERTATLPTIPDVGPDKLLEMPSLNRSETVATLPVYTSRPGTPGGGSVADYELDRMMTGQGQGQGQWRQATRPMAPSRTATSATAGTYSSQASLTAGAAGMGYSRSISPAPSLPSLEMPTRPGAGYSRPVSPAPSLPPPMEPPTRTGTAWSMHSNAGQQQQQQMYAREYTESPVMESGPFAPPLRSPTAPPLMGRPGPSAWPYGPGDGRASPAPSAYSTRTAAAGPNNIRRPAYPPSTMMRSATNPASQRSPAGHAAPVRNLTGPMPRSATAAPQGGEYYERPPPGQGPDFVSFDFDIEGQRGGGRGGPQFR